MPSRFPFFRSTEPELPAPLPTGLLEEFVVPPPPASPPPAPASPPPRPTPAVVRFDTASATLVFASQFQNAESLRSATCLYGAGSWWVPVDLGLEAAREAASSCNGTVHYELDGLLVRDRGWGERPSAGTGPAASSLGEVAMRDLVRISGLVPTARISSAQATVLLPGSELGGIVRRALDLELGVVYQRVELSPLFGPGDSSTCYAVELNAPKGELPLSFVTALEQDPFLLVCRAAGSNLLIQHRQQAALSDRALSALVDEDTWVLAGHGYGCSRLRRTGEPQTGTAIVRLHVDRPLINVVADPRWTPGLPAPVSLTVVPGRVRGQKIDAALLSDEAVACLPALLTGRPLAETATLVLGRDHHLLTAPGGLLEDLPVGEPLNCLGPGQLYLPLGHRLKPLLPPRARRTLLPAESGVAIVLLPSASLVFDLATRIPVWHLWAGPPPTLDEQLPADVQATLANIDQALTPAPKRPTGWATMPNPTAQRPSSSRNRPFRRASPQLQPSWHERAYELEAIGRLEEAAELHRRNGQQLQAARLFERAAEQA